MRFKILWHPTGVPAFYSCVDADKPQQGPLGIGGSPDEALGNAVRHAWLGSRDDVVVVDDIDGDEEENDDEEDEDKEDGSSSG